MKIKSLILWIVCSAIPAFLALLGLSALSPIDRPGQSAFFLALVLCAILWLGFATLLVAFLCWAASKIFPDGARNGR